MTHKKLQRLAENLVYIYCFKYKLKSTIIKVKNLKTSGSFSHLTRFIYIPLWAYEQGGVKFFTAYVLHEIAHLIRYDIYKDTSHDRDFRSLEIKLLKEHNMIPLQYARAFYYRLESINGKLLWLPLTKDRQAEGLKPYKLKDLTK